LGAATLRVLPLLAVVLTSVLAGGSTHIPSGDALILSVNETVNSTW
jgi:hypothetical protein